MKQMKRQLQPLWYGRRVSPPTKPQFNNRRDERGATPPPETNTAAPSSISPPPPTRLRPRYRRLHPGGQRRSSRYTIPLEIQKRPATDGDYNITIPEPPFRIRHLIGSSHGWLVTADDKSELHLLNPITGQQIALPPVITIENVEPILDNGGAIIEYKLWDDSDVTIYALDELRDWLYFKAFVFPDLSTGSYIVVLILFPYRQLLFARVGDCKWTSLPPGWDYEQCVHMDGLLYAFTRTGGVDAFDLTGPTFTRNIIVDEMANYISGTDGGMYAVQTPRGDLLQVCRKSEVTKEILIETEKILVYKTDMAAKKLVEMNGLCDHVLFLGCGQSQCLSAEEYPQLKENS